ncbi:MAG: phosphoribosyl-ATP diphosphatase [Chloroflexi bacterium]|nr:MAG: phosphoribosyl-ATP diphosphatase [Chloroflexota bacterium]
MNQSTVFDHLLSTIAERKANPTPESYTASLFAAGIGKIAQKVGEEGVEVVIAALSQSDDRLVSEMADLLYHSLVLLAARDVPFADVEAELARRFR